MSLLERMTPYTLIRTPDVEERLSAMPPGIVGICSGFLGRYREFDLCVDALWTPQGSRPVWSMGVDVTNNFNSMTRELLSEKSLQWLFVLGDDHVFCQDLVLRLWERDVDIVVPLCLRKTDYTPVLNRGENDGFRTITNSWPEIMAAREIPGKPGLVEWEGTCGNAGMLIRRSVLESLEPPWWRCGQLDPGYGSPDLYFCHAAQRAGFKVHIDLANVIGHIVHAAVWPRRDEAGNWNAEFRTV